MAAKQSPHIAFFQSSGIGLLTPIVQFAKRLISNHNVTSTIIIPTDVPISSSRLLFLDNLPTGIDYIVLPQVNLDENLLDLSPAHRISLMNSRSIPFLRNVIRSLVPSKNLVGLVLDLFTIDYGIDIARDFDIFSYVFWSSNAFAFAFMNYLPVLDETVECEYRELSEPIRIPGCFPLYGKDFLDTIQDRKDEGYKDIVRNLKRMNFVDGIVLNTFEGVEGKTLKATEEAGGQGIPPLYPIGPLVQTNSNSDWKDAIATGCLRWLDDQPRSSVVLVSFGSGGTLSYEQFTELAYGLEDSGQRFIWVIRSPNDKSAAAFFGEANNGDPFSFLPKGFLERTKGRGFVVSSWGPQAAILAHDATGGFVTHCGWNSILEGLVNGVPLIAWPLYAEQKMNAMLITDDLKVALRPKVDENGLVKREEITNVVRNSMEGVEGKVVRDKMKYFQEVSVETLSENGSSTNYLAQLISLWKHKAY